MTHRVRFDIEFVHADHGIRVRLSANVLHRHGRTKGDAVWWGVRMERMGEWKEWGRIYILYISFHARNSFASGRGGSSEP